MRRTTLSAIAVLFLIACSSRQELSFGQKAELYERITAVGVQLLSVRFTLTVGGGDDASVDQAHDELYGPGADALATAEAWIEEHQPFASETAPDETMAMLALYWQGTRLAFSEMEAVLETETEGAYFDALDEVDESLDALNAVSGRIARLLSAEGVWQSAADGEGPVAARRPDATPSAGQLLDELDARETRGSEAETERIAEEVAAELAGRGGSLAALTTPVRVLRDGLGYEEPLIVSEAVMRVTAGETYRAGEWREDGWVKLADAPVACWVREELLTEAGAKD